MKSLFIDLPHLMSPKQICFLEGTIADIFGNFKVRGYSYIKEENFLNKHYVVQQWNIQE